MHSNNLNKKNFFLTSAPFACGIGWLVNVLLKLEIKGTSLLYKKDNWIQTSKPNIWQIGPRSRSHLLNHLPILGEQDEFNFQDGIEFFWEHRLSYPADETCPAIVVIRDPRDAIYSLYRRWAGMGWIKATYLEFLNAPSDWPDHFPGLFHLNPIKTFLFFNLMWLRSSSIRPVLFVRFEDFKTQPLKVIEQVYNFLHLPLPSESSIVAAIHSSSVENARKVMQASSEAQMGAIHKGIVNEWTKTYESAWLACFADPEVRRGLNALGFSTAPQKSDGKLEALTNSYSHGLKERMANAFLERRSLSESNQFIKELSRKAKRLHIDLNKTEKNFELRLLATHWAASWAAGGQGLGERDMRSYLYQAIKLLLRPHEIEYALAKSKELSNYWNNENIQRQKQRFNELNAL